MERVPSRVKKALLALTALGLGVAIVLGVMSVRQVGPFAPVEVAIIPEPEPEPEPITRMSVPVTEIPADSVLFFQNNEGGAMLIADMNAGKVPTSCNVLYDEGGSLPDVTVTDPEVITAIYNYLAHVRVSNEEGSYITDAYHHVSFAMQDGTYVTFRFEGGDLAWGAFDYVTTGSGPLWTLVRALQDNQIDIVWED